MSLDSIGMNIATDILMKGDDVVMGCRGSFVICTDASPDGTKNVFKFTEGLEDWSVKTDASIATSIAVDSSGNVYVGTYCVNNKSIYKYNSSGVLVTTYNTGDRVNCIIVGRNKAWEIGVNYAVGDRVESAGNAYICIQSHLSDGDNAPPNVSYWSILSSPETIYAAGVRSGNNSIWKLDTDLNLIWDFDTGSAVRRIKYCNSNLFAAGDRGTWETDATLGNCWKIDAHGNGLWTRNDTPPSSDGTGAEIDSDGNCYFAGWYNGTSYGEFVLRKYDSTGTLIWSFGYPPYMSYGRISDIIVDLSGNIYCSKNTGHYLIGQDYTATGLHKWNSSGSYQWGVLKSATTPYCTSLCFYVLPGILLTVGKGLVTEGVWRRESSDGSDIKKYAKTGTDGWSDYIVRGVAKY